MKKSAYGAPILIKKEGEKNVLFKLDNFNEAFIQDIVFENPECLPISDIDESFNPLIPICKELNTAVGPLDILMINPNGEIAIIETKLWRNPESRRKVVAQILDYAKELSTWTYEDLQREVNRKLGTNKKSLYEIVKEKNSDLILEEPYFIDSISRNLFRGRFLLLIVGDGIREGASAIAEFLSNSAHLNFTFAQIELNVYKGEDKGVLIVPKTLVKTYEISKLVIDLPKGMSLKSNDKINEQATILTQEQENEKEFYIKFWQELLEELSFDDPGQTIPNPAKAQNLFLYPSISKKIWISAYFAKSAKQVGVYIKAQNDAEGREIIEALNEYLFEIKEELGFGDKFKWNELGDASIKLSCDNILDVTNREKIKDFFKYNLNLFVNVFRPKLKKII
jgi:hypothetical protein